jgi:prepilin-type N-terminal cleavage/methylation domain-containing protein
LKAQGYKGFTLIEVMITLGILTTIIFAVSQMLRSSFDMKASLRQKSSVTRRANLIFSALNHDLSHAFLISNRHSLRAAGKRKTIFKITKSANFDSLHFTYLANDSGKVQEGPLAYAVYEIQESDKDKIRHLARGNTPRQPEDFTTPPVLRTLAEFIESIRFEAWVGDDWSKESWDSTQGDTENKMPHMVRVTIRLWAEEPLPGDDLEKLPIDQFATILYLPYALDFDELKARITSFKMD